MGVRITVRLDGLRRFRTIVDRPSNRTRGALRKWGVIYIQFIRDRFIRFSGGGGNWRRLRAATVEAKRREGVANPEAILRRSDLMLNTLGPELIRAIGSKANTPFSVVVAFDGRRFYPSGQSVADVAGFHNQGGGRLPKRQIIVVPPPEVKREMGNVMQEALVKDLNRK